MVEIWVPITEPPAFVCRICKAPFAQDERFQFERHVVKCAEQHQDALQAASPRQRAPWWFEDVDPEWATYNQILRERGIDPEDQYRKPKKSVKRASES